MISYLVKRLDYKVLVASLVVIMTSASGLYALEIIKPEDLHFDTSIAVKDQEIYALPEKILLTKIDSPNEEITTSGQIWVDMLYYYYISRLEFADIPYNYMVHRDGSVFRGRDGWDGVIPELADPEGVVLIGYMSRGDDFTPSAENSMTELIQDLSDKYGITEDEIEIVELTAVKKDTKELTKLSYNEKRSDFSENVIDLVENMTLSEKDNLTYGATVSAPKYEKTVELGEVFDVEIEVENTGETPMFTVNDFLYLSTKSEEESEFAVNQAWDSFDTPGHIEGVTLFPNDTHKFTFKMKAPLFPGDFKESFVFKRLNQKPISSTAFDVEFQVGAGDLDLIKILETPTGSLNVRDIPSAGGNVVGQVDVDKIYIYVEKQDGWYKIEFGDDDTGWVFGQYAQEQ